MTDSTTVDPSLALEMWSVVDRAVGEVPASVAGIDADAMRLCMTLRTSSNVVFYDLSQYLSEKADVGGHALNVMLIARLHGELEFHRLTKFANMKKATASKLVDSMVNQGLLQRRTSAEDRRVTLLSLTPEGKETFDKAFAAYNERERFWASGLSREEGATLAALLKKLVDSRIALSRLK